MDKGKKAEPLPAGKSPSASVGEGGGPAQDADKLLVGQAVLGLKSLRIRSCSSNITMTGLTRSPTKPMGFTIAD